MTYFFNSLTGKLRWTCPTCGVTQTMPSVQTMAMAENADGCQGCRVKRTLLHDPGLSGLFIDWFRKTGFPQSDSWTAAIHPMSRSMLNQHCEGTCAKSCVCS